MRAVREDITEHDGIILTDLLIIDFIITFYL